MKKQTSEKQNIEKIQTADRLCSYLIGCVFGRWDIRFSIGEKSIPALSDAFSPLPVCPYGMLKTKDGLPVVQSDMQIKYPLTIKWDGILVDDNGHNSDIINYVRKSIEIIFKEKSENVENDICERAHSQKVGLNFFYNLFIYFI